MKVVRNFSGFFLTTFDPPSFVSFFLLNSEMVVADEAKWHLVAILECNERPIVEKKTIFLTASFILHLFL